MNHLDRRQFKTAMAAMLATGLASPAFGGEVKTDEKPAPVTEKTKRTKKTKKGICGGGFRCGAVNASWYYHWVPSPAKKFEGQDQVEFVPMFKSGGDVTQKNLDRVKSLKKSHNVTHVLGFNEPDSKKQGNISVEKAIKLWPKLMNLNLRLGSPGVRDNAAGKAWFKQFMQQAKHRDLKVDFICMHLYPNVRNLNSINQFMRKIDQMYRTYRLPIWITEFSLLNFGSKDRTMTVADNQKFMKLVLPKLNRLPYVERYSWFSRDIAAMFHGPAQENNLTPLGKIYKQTA